MTDMTDIIHAWKTSGDSRFESGEWGVSAMRGDSIGYIKHSTDTSYRSAAADALEMAKKHRKTGHICDVTIACDAIYQRLSRNLHAQNILHRNVQKEVIKETCDNPDPKHPFIQGIFATFEYLEKHYELVKRKS